MAQTPDSNQRFPPMPLDSWAPTKETLHRYLQIVGKIRWQSPPAATTGGTSRST